MTELEFASNSISPFVSDLKMIEYGSCLANNGVMIP